LSRGTPTNPWQLENIASLQLMGLLAASEQCYFVLILGHTECTTKKEKTRWEIKQNKKRVDKKVIHRTKIKIKKK